MSPDAVTSPPRTPAAPIPVWPRYALPAFALVAVLNLVFEAAGPRIGFDLTKPLLMPLLALAILAKARRTPPLLLLALLGATLGDTMLLFGGICFQIGMLGFAIMHVCYIVLFKRSGARRNRRRFLPAALCYSALWIVLITSLWPDLPANMRIPLTFYSLLLATMATHAYAAGGRTGLGGALFLVSDSMIAGGIAHWHMPRGTGFAVMATYILAQYLLVTGVMRLNLIAGRRPRRSGP
ncbi:MAG TPA: lysoplasmalogenase [Actinospica sp.]|nr:lysoplasmalogenase [Actinospica sp.]